MLTATVLAVLLRGDSQHAGDCCDDYDQWRFQQYDERPILVWGATGAGNGGTGILDQASQSL